MSPVEPLTPDELRRRCDPASLGFETSAEVEPLARTVGQPRALRALDFGLDMRQPGYNVFVTGPASTGRRTTVENYLRARAASQPAADDWVYLFNFDEPRAPLVLRFPAGEGKRFAERLREVVDEARRRIPAAFESDQYDERRRELVAEVERRREEVIQGLRERAQSLGLALEVTPAGLVTFPVVGGKPIRRDQMAALPPAARQRIEAAIEQLDEEIPPALKRVRELEREGTKRIAELDREVALFAVGHLLDELRAEFEHVEDAGAWLDRVREDIVSHLHHFRGDPDGEPPVPAPIAAAAREARAAFFARYEANVLVSHAGDGGAPVVFETNPSYYNVFGRIDYESVLGSMSTDHRHIRPGALHRANGGYLMLDVLDVLRQPLVWEKLKEVLRTRRLAVEPLGSQFTALPVASLEPEPIDLDVKVVLIGPALVFQQLFLLDEDVGKLFKVRADFDVEMPWEESEHRNYAAFVANRVQEHGLLHFRNDAVARLIEHGARLAGDQRKLSARLGEINDVICEASHWAEQEERDVVTAADVDRAVEERIYRSNLYEQRILELIDNGTLMIDVAGERTGQVNGLSVSQLGDYEFGHPTRITATTALGEGEMIAIDREVELSGPIHDKGFLILSGYLSERFGAKRPLALHARLVFEQSYGGIEGDSASCAELIALLSSLADVPVRQGIAITGSVNQHGQVQAIGGVNEKIEGHFTVCKRAGLTGEQGVVIPRANARNLMLRDEVVEAVREGKFSIWAVEHVDEALELLTGREPGKPGPDGSYPEGTIYRAVEDRLEELSETRRRLSNPPHEERADQDGEGGGEDRAGS
ncbi:MAG TPA: ATP-binding protein [Solirubrobacterales bacterium]